MKKKTVAQPRRKPLAEAVSAATAPAAEEAVTPRAYKDIAVDSNATGLVRQFIVEQINALPPSQKAVMANTFNQFLNRCVVLAPEQIPA